MRVVADTNIVVSATLWQGTPGKLIALALEGEIELFTSKALLDELSDVLRRRHLAKPVQRTGRTIAELVKDYKRLAYRVSTRKLGKQVSRDTDDDKVLACALAADGAQVLPWNRYRHAEGGHCEGCEVSALSAQAPRTPTRQR